MWRIFIYRFACKSDDESCAHIRCNNRMVRIFHWHLDTFIRSFIHIECQKSQRQRQQQQQICLLFRQNFFFLLASHSLIIIDFRHSLRHDRIDSFHINVI